MSDIGDRVRVRPAEHLSGDAVGIARVHVDTWRASYAGMLPDRVLVNMRHDRQQQSWERALASRDGDMFTLVAETASLGIVGFGGAGRRRGKRDFDGEVFTLYVDPDFQGRAIGRRLLAELFQGLAARGAKSALIWVLAANPSRFFYEAMGGRHVLDREEPVWGTRLNEIGYGWDDLDAAIGALERQRGV